MSKRLSVEILWERIKSDRRARKLQASEYKRRLKILNGEGDRLRVMQETYVQKTSYDATIKEMNDKNWIAISNLTTKMETGMSNIADKLDTRLMVIEKWKAIAEGSTQGVTQTKDKFDKYIPWVFSLLMLIMTYMIYINSKK